jgi:hypothetical protein
MIDLIKNTAFIDIETVAQADEYNKLSADKQALWNKICQNTYRDHENRNSPELLWKEKGT